MKWKQVTICKLRHILLGFPGLSRSPDPFVQSPTLTLTLTPTRLNAAWTERPPLPAKNPNDVRY